MDMGNGWGASVQGNSALFHPATFSLVEDERAFQTHLVDQRLALLREGSCVQRLDPAPEPQAPLFPLSPLSSQTGFLIFTRLLSARNRAEFFIEIKERVSFRDHSLWSMWQTSYSLQALRAVSRYGR